LWSAEAGWAIKTGLIYLPTFSNYFYESAGMNLVLGGFPKGGCKKGGLDSLTSSLISSNLLITSLAAPSHSTKGLSSFTSSGLADF
jgi:hypothetical protein